MCLETEPRYGTKNELEGIQIALGGAEEQEDTGREITMAIDSRAVIRAVERIPIKGRATAEEGRVVGGSIRRLTEKGTAVKLVWVKAHIAIERKDGRRGMRREAQKQMSR